MMGESGLTTSDADRDSPVGSATCAGLLINSGSSADKQREEEGKDEIK